MNDRRHMRLMTVLVAGAICGSGASASETDQYLAWGVEIEDSSGPINAYLNEQAQWYLDEINAGHGHSLDPQDVAHGYFRHLFLGIFSARMREWIAENGEIDCYPDRSVSLYAYQKQSIFRKPIFPYILPMSRTIRVGDVYLGTDKISHMLGFGRRYFNRYLRHMKQGATPEEAEIKVIKWGLFSEQSIVGKLVDGVMSYGDLEANYQGFRLLKDLALADDAIFAWRDGRWTITRPIDLREYVTPDFDESYNNSHYFGPRKGYVLEIYSVEYCELLHTDTVQARFATYREYESSFNQKYIRAHFADRGLYLQADHSVAAMCERNSHQHPNESKEAAISNSFNFATTGSP